MVAEARKVYNDSVEKARWLIALMLLMALFCPGAAFSQTPKAIVVLPFTGGGLSKAELLNLTLLFEERLSRVDSLQVIDQSQREKVLAYLDPVLLTCADIGCAVRIGRALSAATVVMGTIVNESGKLVVSMRVITVSSSRSFKTEGAPVSSAAELPQALRLLASALFGAPLAGAAGSESLTEDQQKQLRLAALESLREDLKAELARIKQVKRTAQTWGWVSLGFGVGSAALAGVSWYLSDLAYQNYLSTSDTDAAERYRQQVTMWDSVMMASAGASILSIGISIPLFAPSPDSRATTKELRRVESEVAALETVR
jgi:TolB-like protein